MNKYYVYVYFEGDTPIYIGAGQGRRDKQHLYLSEKYCPSFHRKLHNMQHKGVKPIVRRLLVGLTFQESRDWERFFIQAMGRRDLGTGPLYNLTDGGEGTANRIASIDTRKQISAAVTITSACPEVKKRMSEAQKVRAMQPGEKQRRSEAAKVALMRPGVKQQMIRSQRIAHDRVEVRQRRSKAQRARFARPEERQRISKARRYQPARKCFKGVRQCGKKWRATIDDRSLGTFLTPEEAAQAYNNGVDRYWDGNGWKNPVGR